MEYYAMDQNFSLKNTLVSIHPVTVATPLLRLNVVIKSNNIHFLNSLKPATQWCVWDHSHDLFMQCQAGRLMTITFHSYVLTGGVSI